jgi:hypothetical protein
LHKHKPARARRERIRPERILQPDIIRQLPYTAFIGHNKRFFVLSNSERFAALLW